MKKKLFSALAVLVILFSMIVPGAFAEENAANITQSQSVIESSGETEPTATVVNEVQEKKGTVQISPETTAPLDIQSQINGQLDDAYPINKLKNGYYQMIHELTSDKDCYGRVVGPGIGGERFPQQYIYTMNGIRSFCTDVMREAYIFEFDGWVDNNNLGNLPFYSYSAEYTKNGDPYYILAVQWLVWEHVHNATSYPENNTVSENMKILKKAAEKAYTKPSFDGQTIDIEVGKSITIEDTNGVLGSEFNDFVGTITTDEGINISKNGNKITITVAPNAPSGDHNVTMEKYPGQYIGDSMYYQPVNQNGNPDYNAQAMRSFKFKDQFSCNFKVNVKSGRLQIQKKDNVDPNVAIKDVKFKVSKNADMSNPIGTYSTLEDGKTQIVENLVPGIYYVQEVYVPGAWVVDNTIKAVQVDATSPEMPLTVF